MTACMSMTPQLKREKAPGLSKFEDKAAPSAACLFLTGHAPLTISTRRRRGSVAGSSLLRPVLDSGRLARRREANLSRTRAPRPTVALHRTFSALLARTAGLCRSQWKTIEARASPERRPPSATVRQRTVHSSADRMRSAAYRPRVS